MKIAAVVILYRPDANLIANIMSYSAFVDVVYAIDNSEKPGREIIELLTKIGNCVYFGDHENKGIGARINQAAQMAIQENCTWLLTMDQDSSFENIVFENYLTCCLGYKEVNKVALFGVQHETESENPRVCDPVRVNQLITSGSLVNLSIFQQTGGYDESLFIDQVDFEYCYRSIKKGFLVVQFDNIYLKHQLGNPALHRSLKTLAVTTRSLHSPVRIYYMLRNFLYIRSIYKREFKHEIDASKKDILNRLKNNLLYNRKRLAVLWYSILAITHYMVKRTGKL